MSIAECRRASGDRGRFIRARLSCWNPHRGWWPFPARPKFARQERAYLRHRTEDFCLDGQRLQIRCTVKFTRDACPWNTGGIVCRWPRRWLNTVCAYLFGNMHEPKPGDYVWTGRGPMRNFRIAQEEGCGSSAARALRLAPSGNMGGSPWWC